MVTVTVLLTARLIVVAGVAEEVSDLVFLATERKREGERVAALGVVNVVRVYTVEAVDAADVGVVDAGLFAAVAAVVTYDRAGRGTFGSKHDY